MIDVRSEDGKATIPRWSEAQKTRADAMRRAYRERQKNGNSDVSAARHVAGKVYAGVLTRRADGGSTNADTAAGRVVWADFDGTDPREALRRTTAGLPAGDRTPRVRRVGCQCAEAEGTGGRFRPQDAGMTMGFCASDNVAYVEVSGI